MGVLMGWLRHPGTANDHPQRMIKKTAATTSDHAHADADAGAGADADADAVADADADADADDIALRSVIALVRPQQIGSDPVALEMGAISTGGTPR